MASVSRERHISCMARSRAVAIPSIALYPPSGAAVCPGSISCATSPSWRPRVVSTMTRSPGLIGPWPVASKWYNLPTRRKRTPMIARGSTGAGATAEGSAGIVRSDMVFHHPQATQAGRKESAGAGSRLADLGNRDNVVLIQKVLNADLGGNIPGGRHQGLCGRRVRVADQDRNSIIAAHAHLRIHWDF